MSVLSIAKRTVQAARANKADIARYATPGRGITDSALRRVSSNQSTAGALRSVDELSRREVTRAVGQQAADMTGRKVLREMSARPVSILAAPFVLVSRATLLFALGFREVIALLSAEVTSLLALAFAYSRHAFYRHVDPEND